jgi:esterase/lipase superfamily enzyme
MRTSAVPEIAEALGTFIRSMRDREGYYGLIDIVCHSMGSWIARFYFRGPKMSRRMTARIPLPELPVAG